MKHQLFKKLPIMAAFGLLHCSGEDIPSPEPREHSEVVPPAATSTDKTSGLASRYGELLRSGRWGGPTAFSALGRLLNTKIVIVVSQKSADHFVAYEAKWSHLESTEYNTVRYVWFDNRGHYEKFDFDHAVDQPDEVWVFGTRMPTAGDGSCWLYAALGITGPSCMEPGQSAEIWREEIAAEIEAHPFLYDSLLVREIGESNVVINEGAAKENL